MHTTKLSEAEIAMAACLLTAMGNRKRMLILDIVSKNETSVGKLAVMLGMGQSALSQQLTILKNAELVQTRRDGHTIYYRTDSKQVRMILATLYELFDIAVPSPRDGEIANEILVTG